jgi:hypothetical protein
MNHHRWRLLGLGAAVFLLAVVIRAPADLVLILMRDRIPVPLVWEQVTGTVFDATISGVEVSLPRDRRIRLDSLQVRSALLPLLVGRLSINFHATCCNGNITGRAILRGDNWRLPEIAGDLSLGVLAGIAPETEAMGITGRIRFSGKDLSGTYRALPGTGIITLAAEDVGVDLLAAQTSLGSYTLELEAVGTEGIQGDVLTTTREALLLVTGKVNASPDGKRLNFNGRISTGVDATDEVRSILPLLGVVENGQVIITRNFLL